MKVVIKLGKVNKFGIGWCIPHRMAADNTKGGAPHLIGLRIAAAIKIVLKKQELPSWYL